MIINLLLCVVILYLLYCKKESPKNSSTKISTAYSALFSQARRESKSDHDAIRQLAFFHSGAMYALNTKEISVYMPVNKMYAVNLLLSPEEYQEFLHRVKNNR